ncbi:MAG: DUF3515 domain-containing protein [Microbacterium sp.]|jgi:hypothetical protein|uniref:DUF3515 family protein n=1 Tax=unclassified Microbacterium TaxID=2609290 RepID=UPI000DB58276|nr:DUF3515 family protein [Microbacterium sp.]PZU38982.1 MAG: DUF3515 domain-containing protein [Microbacterium sp.]
MPRPRRAPLAIAVLTLSLGLTACGQTVSLEAAPEADDPLCAEVSVRLPAVVDGKERRWTDAQATGAWGSPTAVIVTCGVEPPGPTTLPCQSVDGVDWIIDDADAPRYLVTSFGRTPAVEIYLDNDAETGVSSAAVLEAISPAVATLPVDGVCTDRPAG